MPVLPKNHSNVLHSLVLHERLQELLRDCDVADIPFRRRRASRQWIAAKIGCSPGTLTTSSRLRKTLELWERVLPERQIPTFTMDDEIEFDDASIIPFPRAELVDIIFPTTISIRGGTYKVPVLFAGDRVDEWVTSFLRHLRVMKKCQYSTVEETAKKLRTFRKFQRLHKVETADVSDDFLLAWQHSMKAAGIKLNRRNDCLSTVHNFFKWAEERGHLKYHIQLRAKGDYKDLGEDYIFPISATEKLVTRRGVTISTWVSTMIERGGHSSFGTRHTPTLKEVETLILEVEAHRRNNTRNRLMVSWVLDTGARNSELVQIKVSDLPSTEDAIGKFLDSGDEYLNVTVDRKNKGKDTLRAHTDLVLATFDYLFADADRKKIITSRRGKANSDYVFLSEAGGVLTTDSITRIFRRFFAAAKIENANIHRLRARFITEIIEGCLDDLASTGQCLDMTSDWSETVLTMARGRMGHSHIMSLRPYLNEIKVRRIQIDGVINPRDDAARKRQQDGLRKQIVQRIVHSAAMTEVDRLNAAGEKHAAIAKMRQIADEMEARLVEQGQTR